MEAANAKGLGEKLDDWGAAPSAGVEEVVIRGTGYRWEELLMRLVDSGRQQGLRRW